MCRKDELKNHVVSAHEGNKPFKCEVCNHRFSRESDLKKHVASVHEGKDDSNVKFVNTELIEKVT